MHHIPRCALADNLAVIVQWGGSLVFLRMKLNYQLSGKNVLPLNVLSSPVAFDHVKIKNDRYNGNLGWVPICCDCLALLTDGPAAARSARLLGDLSHWFPWDRPPKV